MGESSKDTRNLGDTVEVADRPSWVWSPARSDGMGDGGACRTRPRVLYATPSLSGIKSRVQVFGAHRKVYTEVTQRAWQSPS